MLVELAIIAVVAAKGLVWCATTHLLSAPAASRKLLMSYFWVEGLRCSVWGMRGYCAELEDGESHSSAIVWNWGVELCRVEILSSEIGNDVLGASIPSTARVNNPTSDSHLPRFACYQLVRRLSDFVIGWYKQLLLWTGTTLSKAISQIYKLNQVTRSPFWSLRVTQRPSRKGINLKALKC